MLAGLLENKILLTALIAWALAQGLKLPIMSFIQRRWNWSVLLSAGGMPSSHAALIVSCANAIGLWQGYNSPLFALGAAMAMIVLYDAAGVRRQAGIHAARINFLFEELLQGHPWDEEELREVLGHTPLEVLAGGVLGIGVSILIWALWR
jgi:acid phosphatase family membrane protein YuiD